MCHKNKSKQQNLTFNEQQQLKLKKLEQSKKYQTALKYEQICLSQSGLELEKEIKIFNQPIQLKDNSLEFIHTYNCGFQENLENSQKQKEILVLLHGYAGSSMTYVKCLKELSKQYNVYSLDILGIGLSSKPDFDIRDPQEIIDYFVYSLEAWLQSMKITEKFTLAGHSFGGYISGMFSLKNHQKLNNLILISPVGGTFRDDREIEEIEESFMKNNGFFKRWMFQYFKSAFKDRKGPTRFLNSWYFPSKYVISRYFKKRVGLPQKEVDMWENYMYSVFQLPESTEKGFFDLFKFPSVTAQIPLENVFSQLDKQNLNVLVYYGSFDWMNTKGMKNLSRQYNWLNLEIIPEAGHQIVFENPEYLTKSMNQVDIERIKNIQIQNQKKQKE